MKIQGRTSRNTLLLLLICINTFSITAQDFLINDDFNSDLWQKDPAVVAVNESGASVMVWRDSRNGSLDIYAQRYDESGNPVGGNIRVNDNPAEAENISPSVDINANGEFVVCWTASPEQGYFDLYGQRFSANGEKTGGNFRIDDNTDPIFDSYYADIAVADDGQFMVTWQDDRSGSFYPEIYAQLFASDGSPIGSNFLVNTEGTTETFVAPDIGVDDNGHYLIVWADNRASFISHIYAQRYDNTANPIGGNFLLSDWSFEPQNDPAVAVWGDASFVVCWRDYRNGFSDPDIYYRLFDEVNNPLGASAKANDDPSMNEQSHAAVACGEDGSFVIAWEDNRQDIYDVFAQRFSASGSPVGTNFLADDFAGLGFQNDPSLGMRDDGAFLIAWTDDRNEDDIIGLWYGNDGTPLSNSFKVNDDVGAAHQTSPAVAMNSSSQAVIVWQDGRDDGFFGNIYGQLISSSGFSGANFLVNSDFDFGDYQEQPSVAMDANGNFTVVWIDKLNPFGSKTIKAQQFDGSANPIGNAFDVAETTGSWQVEPDIAMDEDGNYVVVWTDDRDDDDVWARVYTASSGPLAPEFKANDLMTNATPQASVSMQPDGEFVLAWSDGNIWARLFDSAGAPLAPAFRVNEVFSMGNYYRPAVAIDQDGHFVVVWQDFKAGWEDPDIYGQEYDSSGNPIGSNFKVNDDIEGYWQKNPSVGIDPEGGRFFVTWSDNREGDGDFDIYGQAYSSSVKDGSNTLIHSPDAMPYYHQDSRNRSVMANTTHLALCWMDTRREKGWDTYGKLTDWNLQTVGEEETVQPESGLELFPNPTAGDAYLLLPEGSDRPVDIRVFDMTGRQVFYLRKLYHQRTVLPSRAWPKGIYLVQLRNEGQLLAGARLVVQ